MGQILHTTLEDPHPNKEMSKVTIATEGDGWNHNYRYQTRRYLPQFSFLLWLL
jgi:hypothetical protein